MDSSDTSRPPLSILVATVGGWDEIKGCLEVLLPQAERTGAEVLVGDSTEDVYPIAHPSLRVTVRPGESVFELRAALVGAAKGAIVAVTEDHCRAAPDWCERMLSAHDRHPEAALVGGRMVNGSPRKLVDWANFLLTFSPFLDPTATRRGSRIPPAANVSYKRGSLPERPVTGEIEIALPERLQAEGRVVMVDDAVVTHIQAHGFFSTFSHHYDNGRTTAGLALGGAPGAARRRRVRVALLAAPRLLWETVRNTVRRGVPWRARLSLPLVAAVIACHTVGEMVGSLRGPGTSPMRLA